MLVGESSWTAAHKAARNGHTAVVECLARGGALLPPAALGLPPRRYRVVPAPALLRHFSSDVGRASSWPTRL
jgi:hypothetical protein